MRVLGLDYGSKTVGVAVSDPLGLTAQGVETVWRKQENKLRRTLARIEEIISEYQVTEIVLGSEKHEQYSRRAGREISGVLRKCWRNVRVCLLLCGMRD